MAPEDIYNTDELVYFVLPHPTKQDIKHKEKFVGAKLRRIISLLL